MFITYCRNQISLDTADTTNHRLQATGGIYRPTYLMRVSDWKKVPGEEAIKGYCALSYVPEQSGQVVQKEENGEYDYIDHDEHCIIEGYNHGDGFLTKIKKRLLGDMSGDSLMMIPIREGEKIKYIVGLVKYNGGKATVKHVTYEKLLQQLCKDFQIEYLWYDKICMDPPDDNGTKLREIKQMHRIYGNACYTVAMVPEVHIHNRNDFDTIHSVLKVRKAYVRAWADIGQTSLWWKHSRVLEETLASKRILVIGTDTHIWQDNSSYTCNMFTIGDDDVSKQTFDLANQRHPGRENVNQASTGKINNLQASSKQQHDIFPLVNIMSKNIEKIDYKINTKIAFHHFYRTMAIYDLSMLCFGSNYHLNGSTVRENTMKNSYKLPSWTGVFGLSIPERVTATTTLFESSHFICDGMLLHIPTKYYKTLSIIAYSHGCFTPLSHNKQQRDEQVAIFHKRMNATGPYNAVEGEETVLIDWAIQMKKFSHCYATHYYQPQDGSVMQARPLSLTEDCKKCIILPILFKSDSLLVNKRKEPRQPFRPYFGDTHDYYLPVLKKITYRTSNNTTEERFKVVGIYFLGSPYFGDLISSGDLENILHSVFGNDTTHDEVKEFIIQ